ncbi:unnamed protein product [Oppiella nova]|uniref:Uncharacterized protein n=1 Tax=Oppiella nova TaxID=334625 RepID=A0A7R9MNU0_9ACAR|nr:unnamed protein product [Oppiella nova]CAG2180626.1 unnamed protein product [Oppiella nova]
MSGLNTTAPGVCPLLRRQSQMNTNTVSTVTGS